MRHRLAVLGAQGRWLRRLAPWLVAAGLAQGSALAAQGWQLDFPFPVLSVATEPAEHAAYALPVGPFAAGALPSDKVEGMVDRRAYRLKAPGASLLDVLAPLRAQIEAAGYRVVFDCVARVCGGFDFRFATEVMAEPGMHVDLGDFSFLAARRGPDEVLSLLVSRAGDTAFVQVIRVGAEPLPALPGSDLPDPGADPGADPADPVAPVAPVAPPAPIAPVAGPGDAPVAAAPLPRLEAGLPVVLEDLVFGSGSATLEPGDYASLRDLAAWLAADPARSLALVGHSDASGGLSANVALSKRRAEAVRETLIKDYGVAAGQISADGVGPLAPRDTNLTEEGRRSNRRVEAVPAP
ncbi:OmpA family protein [Xinfangfangia pollutisoli]|uniref:OmpA family protein n=1 Tax=Xinfangfangia pollutisoli TaxID=2865960 RepID=UPI001CD592BB|nr:OmpA family protein [Xinfangfangia pollutisoli]